VTHQGHKLNKKNLMHQQCGNQLQLLPDNKNKTPTTQDCLVWISFGELMLK